MNDFHLVFGDKIFGASKVISEYRLLVDKQSPEIGIRISESCYADNGVTRFSYELSHQYFGSDQKGVCDSGNKSGFESEQQALRRAKDELLSFYNAEDPKGSDAWVPNPDYYLGGEN